MQSTQHAHSLPTFTHYNRSMQRFEQGQFCADKTNKHIHTDTNIHKSKHRKKKKTYFKLFTKICMFGKKSCNKALHLEIVNKYKDREVHLLFVDVFFSQKRMLLQLTGFFRCYV